MATPRRPVSDTIYVAKKRAIAPQVSKPITPRIEKDRVPAAERKALPTLRRISASFRKTSSHDDSQKPPEEKKRAVSLNAIFSTILPKGRNSDQEKSLSQDGKRAVSLGNFVSSILPKNRRERGHTLRENFDPQQHSAVDLLFGLQDHNATKTETSTKNGIFKSRLPEVQQKKSRIPVWMGFKKSTKSESSNGKPTRASKKTYLSKSKGIEAFCEDERIIPTRNDVYTPKQIATIGGKSRILVKKDIEKIGKVEGAPTLRRTFTIPEFEWQKQKESIAKSGMEDAPTLSRSFNIPEVEWQKQRESIAKIDMEDAHASSVSAIEEDEFADYWNSSADITLSTEDEEEEMKMRLEADQKRMKREKELMEFMEVEKVLKEPMFKDANKRLDFSLVEKKVKNNLAQAAATKPNASKLLVEKIPQHIGMETNKTRTKRLCEQTSLIEPPTMSNATKLSVAKKPQQVDEKDTPDTSTKSKAHRLSVARKSQYVDMKVKKTQAKRFINKQKKLIEKTTKSNAPKLSVTKKSQHFDVDDLKVQAKKLIEERKNCTETSTASDTAKLLEAKKMFVGKKLARELRRSYRESDDYLGIQGSNPRTGLRDPSVHSTSSQASSWKVVVEPTLSPVKQSPMKSPQSSKRSSKSTETVVITRGKEELEPIVASGGKEYFLGGGFGPKTAEPLSEGEGIEEVSGVSDASARLLVLAITVAVFWTFS